MTIRVSLSHKTSYHYDRVVELGPQVVRLRPAPHTRQNILGYGLVVRPEPHFLNWQQDPFGNYLARIVFPQRVRRFEVEVALTTELAVFNPFDFFLEPDAEHFPFTYDDALRADLAAYLQPAHDGPLLQAWLAEVDRGKRPLVNFLVELNRQLAEHVEYVIRMEPGVQDPEETLERRLGSCRDSAWLLVQIMRHLGIAARFVSGYLIQLKPDVASLDGPSGTDHDFTDLHAWTEVFLPGAGWVGLDPTSGLLAGEGHIPLACTPSFASAAPITGTMEAGAEVDFTFDMQVSRVLETARVTKPYTETQWRAIDALGDRVQADLDTQDVRLTIGGEPTFVGIDDPDAAEWNTEALGEQKRARAEDLVLRLRNLFAPGGMLHVGQGKHYPGEQLPRWAYAIYWRADGVPLGTTQARGAKPVDALRFGRGVAARLSVSGEAVQHVYEDPWEIIAAEDKLPLDVALEDNQLDDPLKRARLARIATQGLGGPVGAVLPVQRWQSRDGRSRWRTTRWKTRGGRLWLVPGDASLGFRLPLKSLPYLAHSQYPHVVPQDPSLAREPLPDMRHVQPFLATGEAPAQQTLVEQTLDENSSAVRTALTFQCTDGVMRAFIPPVASLEDYLELLAAVQDTAAELEVALVVEGYPPPNDPRLHVLKVTPDPGVIEVNVHPAHGWRALVHTTSSLYEEARLARLQTQKFMVDGRHTGTGGGNHVVVGGATPADSPFLRRPDLLKSLIAFWQQHPSLSYLFSGLFIGPTSQSPRIDEARMDSLYELELAMAQVPGPGAGTVPPWLTDRLFRNLLVDVTGNTHRAEICIDKLFSPDSSTGRLGLVEFRAFEMPPHAQMSLVQQLLLMAVIAEFWAVPNSTPLVRWGTRLHDEFMLPHFVRHNFRDALSRLTRHRLEESWFEPHFEFRFPSFGGIDHDGMHLELRQALEPWHVMGEEGAIGGTVRYVDSSVERLQVRVTQFDAERYCVVCNRHVVPLTSTERPGEYVGGVRFRAWQPPSSLHPNIPVNVPLVFDLYDRRNGHAVAGCTYHASHPGGRNFDTLPVNAYEAESRRLARFQSFGTTGLRYQPRELSQRPEYARTLDLRRSGLE